MWFDVRKDAKITKKNIINPAKYEMNMNLRFPFHPLAFPQRRLLPWAVLAFVLLGLTSQAHARAQVAGCELKDSELVATTKWTVDQNGKAVSYTEYYYDSGRVDELQGTELTANEAFTALRSKVAAQTETNAMVLLDRYLKALKSRDPNSPNLVNGTLVLEHQAGQVFQLSCAESIVLGKVLEKYPSRQVEVNYLFFAKDDSFRLYFAIPDTRPSQRLVLRSDLATQHLASGALDAYDLRVIGFSQGFSFADTPACQQGVTGGELLPDHSDLPKIKNLAEAFNAHVAMTNGFETMSYDSYELGLMSCPACQTP